MSPGNDRGRPQRTDGPNSVNPTTTSVTAKADTLAVTRGDWDALLANVTSHEDPAFIAASILADSWGPALAAADRLGYERGFRLGLIAGRAEEAEAWGKIMGTWRETIKRPTFAELKHRRGETG